MSPSLPSRLISLTYGVIEMSGRILEEIDLMYAGDNDPLFVVDKRGALLLGFRNKMNHVDELESSGVHVSAFH